MSTTFTVDESSNLKLCPLFLSLEGSFFRSFVHVNHLLEGTHTSEVSSCVSRLGFTRSGKSFRSLTSNRFLGNCLTARRVFGNLRSESRYVRLLDCLFLSNKRGTLDLWLNRLRGVSTRFGTCALISLEESIGI